MSSVKVQGLDRFLSRLGGMPEAVRTEVSEALEANGERLVSLSKSLAPRGETGALVDSIRAEMDSDGLGLSVKAGGPATTKEVREGSGVSYDYAMGQEHGNEHTPKHPYLYPAARALRRVMRARLTRAVKRGVAKSGGGS